MNITSPAIEYWMNELANRRESTRENYLNDFNKFLEYTQKTADELLAQREEDLTSKDKKIQRRIESLLKAYTAHLEKDGFSPATQQRVFASIKSFFEMHYCPLRMRKGDYPTGDSIGVRRATKEAILKALNRKTTRRRAIANALIMFAKDSGLREGDIRRLNYGDIAKGLESNAKIIPITIITEKCKIVAKTFIGEEAIDTLKAYLEARRKGNRNIPPEQLTETSSLFATWTAKTHKRIPRTTIANTIRNAFLRTNEPNISPHSLRKYLQTSLEEANVNVNWIDQILGHKLINSRDAYSKPTDEQLREAYTKAYRFIKVYPQLETEEPKPQPQPTAALSLEQLAQLLAQASQLLSQSQTRSEM